MFLMNNFFNVTHGTPMKFIIMLLGGDVIHASFMKIFTLGGCFQPWKEAVKAGFLLFRRVDEMLPLPPGKPLSHGLY